MKKILCVCVLFLFPTGRDKAPSPPKGCSRRDLAFVRPYEPLPVGLDASPGALPSPGHLRPTCAIQAPAIDVALQGARG